MTINNKLTSLSFAILLIFGCSSSNETKQSVIEVSDGDWYISNTGWDKHGLFIAPLTWETK